MLNGSFEKADTTHSKTFEHIPATSAKGYARNDISGQMYSTEHNREQTRSAVTNGSQSSETRTTTGEN